MPATMMTSQRRTAAPATMDNNSNSSVPSGGRSTPPPVPPSQPLSKKRKTNPVGGKSTTTVTTTAATSTQVNVYDAVLGEARDLLNAAAEAQALGRLKMASAYQLLLHARLVGLGKRFDRAQVQGHTVATEPSESAKKSLEMEQAKPQIQSELAKMLPQNVEFDDTMMEHLARKAMELHHQRTGRRIASDNVAAAPKLSQTSIVWTEQERTKLENALESGTKDPANIASLLKTRTEAQVKAYMKNSEQRQKGSAQMEEEFTSEIASPRRQYRGGRGKKPPTQAMNTVPNANLDTKSLLSGKGL
jgi:hypothetical protein